MEMDKKAWNELIFLLETIADGNGKHAMKAHDWLMENSPDYAEQVKEEDDWRKAKEM